MERTSKGADEKCPSGCFEYSGLWEDENSFSILFGLGGKYILCHFKEKEAEKVANRNPVW